MDTKFLLELADEMKDQVRKIRKTIADNYSEEVILYELDDLKDIMDRLAGEIQ